MGRWAGALSQESYTSPGSTSQHLDVLWQVHPLLRVQGVIQEGQEMPCSPEQRRASPVGLYGRSGTLPTTIWQATVPSYGALVSNNTFSL